MAIIRKEAYFNSSTGKNKIHCMIWQDDAVKPIALFQIAMVCLSILSDTTILPVSSLGMALSCAAMTTWGTENLSTPWMISGIWTIKTAISAWLMICISCITSCTSATPDLPYFLFGHSMGSFLSRSYAAHFGKELAGAIFCGTGELPASLEGVVSASTRW